MNKDYKEVIVYRDFGTTYFYVMYDCAIDCEECPYKFMCLTTDKVPIVTELAWETDFLPLNVRHSCRTISKPVALQIGELLKWQ